MEQKFKAGKDVVVVEEKEWTPSRAVLVVNGLDFDIAYTVLSDNHLHLRVTGPDGTQSFHAYSALEKDGRRVQLLGASTIVEALAVAKQRKAGARPAQHVTPPMPAKVSQVLVAVGDQVKKGDPVLKVSAMKMETTLCAPHKGVVARIMVAVGDRVAPGQVLVDIEKRDEQSTQSYMEDLVDG